MSHPAIVVEGLVKHFGGVKALQGIDLEVQPGTVFGLLGPNGAGKTTAVRILATILRPDGGRAEILGHDVATDPWGVRQTIGLAGQYAAVDPNLTGTENLRMVGQLAHVPRREIAPRAVELLEQFSLSDAADRPAKTYSGGMRRRLDLAAALVQRPRVLFLDEPTTGLDPQSRSDLWETIRNLVRDGTTVLLTTQYMEEADRLAGLIAVIDDGRVIAEGTPRDLKSKLGSSVIEIGMNDESETQKAEELLSKFTVEREGTTLRISSGQGAKVLTQVLRVLDSAQLAPASLAVREPSLDDVFMTLTGKHVTSDEAAAGAAS